MDINVVLDLSGIFYRDEGKFLSYFKRQNFT